MSKDDTHLLSGLNSTINNTINNYSNDIINPNRVDYKFTLVLNDDMVFIKQTTNTYAHIITKKNKVKIDNINKYMITVTKTINNIEEEYNLEGVIDNNHTTISNHNTNIFIEFTCNNILLCACFVKNNNIIVSPPN